jgi:hypothetical protein
VVHFNDVSGVEREPAGQGPPPPGTPSGPGYYNHEHRHSGIGLNTPADVHYGLAAAKAIQRASTLDAARKRFPERFSTNHAPQILSIPETV